MSAVSDYTIVKLVAMLSGLLILVVLAALGALHGYGLTERAAVASLAACVVCYGAQLGAERRILLFLAYAASFASWVFGLGAIACYLWGR